MKVQEHLEHGSSMKPGDFIVSFDSAKKSITVSGLLLSPRAIAALLALAKEVSFPAEARVSMGKAE